MVASVFLGLVILKKRLSSIVLDWKKATDFSGSSLSDHLLVRENFFWTRLVYFWGGGDVTELFL